MLKRVLVVVGLVGCGGAQRPIVVEAGALVACPSSPNCVSSLADPSDEEHYIEPWASDGATVPDLAAFLAAQRRCEVLEEGPSWVHGSCKTPLMRFTDDVAFLLDGDVLHVRSASRVGHSDLGKNRSRIEDFRAAWEAR